MFHLSFWYKNHDDLNSFIGKPMVDNSNITLGVTDTTGLNFSVIVIAYPEPQYELNHNNGTINNQMMYTFTRNAVNSFTINFNQKTVNECDRGTYHLKIWNLYGETTIIVNIFKQSKYLQYKLWLKIHSM